MNLSDTQVGLLTCASYAQPALVEQINTLIRQIAQQELPTLRTAQVLLKPNLVSLTGNIRACSEPAFLLAVAQWFVDHGAKVSIGDSPAIGSTKKSLTALGVAPALQKLGVTCHNFSHTQAVQLPSGVQTALAAETLETDWLVNLPRVKAHGQLMVTLAVKNYFGCLVGMRKPWWHVVHGANEEKFTRLLAELLTVLPDGITLIDGIIAMHETGPINGIDYPLGLIGAAKNPVALDLALLEILGLPIAKSPLHQACQQAKIGMVANEKLQFPFAQPQALRVNDFLLPATRTPISFNPLYLLGKRVSRAINQLMGQ